MTRTAYWMLYAVSALLLSSCSAHRPDLAPLVAGPAELAAAAPERIDTRDGIFVDYSSYRLKVRSRPFISILDEIFYQKRFNYTISDDVPNAFITVQADESAAGPWEAAQQKKFTSLHQLLQYLVRKVNNEPADGSEVKRCSPDMCRDDVIDIIGLADDVLNGRDQVSLGLVKKHRDLLEVVTRHAPRFDRDLSRLAAQLQDVSSREYQLFKQLMPEGGKQGTDVSLRDRYDAVVDEARTRLITDINEFIKNESGSEFDVLLSPYLSTADLEALKNSKTYDPATRALMYATLKRKCIESIYANRIARSNRYRFRYLTDGIELFREKDILSANNPVVFKKIFLFNMTSEEAKTRIGELFDSKNRPETSVLHVSTFPAQNALMISANRDIAEKIGQNIFSLDSDSNTVLVETKIFEYDDSLDNKLGAAISFSNKLNSREKIDVSTFFSEGILATSMPIFAYGLTDSDKKLSLLAQIAANSRDGAVRITAEPRLVMKPGEKSSIKIVTNKKVFTTSTGDAPGDLKDVTAETKLDITPTILSDKKIMLDVELQQMEFIPNSEPNVALVTSNNFIKSKIIVNDGELLSIGGLKTKKQSRFHSGIPYLREIPYLGVLFGSKTEASTVVDIEFMLRPTIKYTSEQNRHQLKTITAVDDGLLRSLDREQDSTNRDLHHAIESP